MARTRGVAGDDLRRPNRSVAMISDDDMSEANQPADNENARSSTAITGDDVSGNRDEKSLRFISLFAKNQYAVHAYIRALVPNRVDAEDVMQDVSLTLWNKWGTFDSDTDPDTDFVRWACAVSFIEVLRYRRKSAKDKLWFNESLMELLAEDFRRNADTYSARLDALSTCLEKLGSEDRRLIEYRYRQGGSVRCLADSWGRPLSTIYKSLLRIRESLRRCIDHTIAAQNHPSQQARS